MEIEYVIEPRDYEAFLWHQYKTKPSLRRSYLLGYAWVPLFFVLLLLVSRRPFSWWGVVPGLVIVAVSALLYKMQLTRNFNRASERLRSEGRNKGILGRHKIIVSEKELIEWTEVGESHHQWEGIEKVAQDQNYIYIYTTSISAHVIPKRAFATEEEAEGFYGKVERYFAKRQA